MPNPLDFINFLADTLRDPEQRRMLLESMALGVFAVMPAALASLGFSRHAKKQGRTTAGAAKLSRGYSPFLEPRLNEAFGLIRQNYFKILLLGSLPVFILASFISDNAAYLLTVGFTWTAVSAPRIFVEACMAFGAELAPVPEDQQTFTPVPGS